MRINLIKWVEKEKTKKKLKRSSRRNQDDDYLGECVLRGTKFESKRISAGYAMPRLAYAERHTTRTITIAITIANIYDKVKSGHLNARWKNTRCPRADKVSKYDSNSNSNTSSRSSSVICRMTTDTYRGKAEGEGEARLGEASLRKRPPDKDPRNHSAHTRGN